MKIYTRTRTNYAILTMHFYFWILLAVFSVSYISLTSLSSPTQSFPPPSTHQPITCTCTHIQAAKLHILRTDHHDFKRRGSKYRTTDQITDCVVLLAMVTVSTVVTALTPSVNSAMR